MNDPNKRDVKKPRSKHEETILLRFSFTLSRIDIQYSLARAISFI